MTVKELIRPIPGMRRLSRLRQQLSFPGSADYWEMRYLAGKTSGHGSYGHLGHWKAEFLNSFVRHHDVRSVIEFGCGDGYQLSLADYPQYVGLDVSRRAIGLCKGRFAGDSHKSFFLYEGDSFVDRAGLFTADLALSLDVIYHLIEDEVYEAYMYHLFSAGGRYVVVYSTNELTRDAAPHVRHRNFSRWVEDHCSEWKLVEVVPGPNSAAGRADFYIYHRGNANTAPFNSATNRWDHTATPSVG
jgi:hypothetical protein